MQLIILEFFIHWQNAITQLNFLNVNTCEIKELAKFLKYEMFVKRY